MLGGGGVQVNVGGVQNMLGGARMKLGGCAPPQKIRQCSYVNMGVLYRIPCKRALIDWKTLVRACRFYGQII